MRNNKTSLMIHNRNLFLQSSYVSFLAKFLILIFSFLFLNVTAFAQKENYTTTNKSAIRSYEQATKYYDARNNEAALKELQNAISKDEKFVEAYILLSNVYVDINQYSKAIEQMQKVVQIAPDFFPNNWYTLGQIELNSGKYADAKIHFNKFLSYPNISPSLKLKSQRAVINCDFAVDAMQHPIPFKPENLGAGVNSKADEYYPSFTVDGKTLIFTRNEKDPNQDNMPQEDFYISKFENSKWGTAINAGNPLNTSLNEGAPSISSDGKILFFAACNRDDGFGHCDIYFSRNVNGRWITPKNIGGPINTSAWETQPSFSSDGKTLYFVRGVYINERDKQDDIYSSSIGDDGAFQKPVKLNNNINTDEAEESVFIHPDDQTLYFSTRGLPGMGGLDIYMSRRDANGEWGKAINLGYPINTYNDENSLLVSPDGSKAYFASDRDSGFGGLDLYQFDLDASLRPEKITYVKGIVTDANNSAPLPANYEIIDIETGRTLHKGNSEKGTGEFMKALTAGKDYLLNVSQPGYLFYSDHFSCKTAVDFNHPYLINIKMNVAKAGEKVVLKNIFFDTDSFNLKKESFIELDKLVAFLKQNPKTKIQISGHTDNTGDKKRNQLLSENRAHSVLNYLLSKGIDRNNLLDKGFGDTQPIATNDTEEGRTQNRRTEFLILSTE
ncbi:MAG: OmpA family protein [Bacteroidia bacterium]